MRFRTLGRTGVDVSAVSLGTMMFGAWGNRDHDECVRMAHRAFDEGVNLVDTADMYSAGEAETIVGKAIAGRRDEVIVATKAFWPMSDRPNDRGGSRLWLMRAVEHSLRRLDTDHIDLLYLHKRDERVDLDESLGALSDLVRAGKVRYAGCSSFPAHDLVAADWIARTGGHVRFASEQPNYSIVARAAERDILPTAARLGMGVLCWSPLAGGLLARGTPSLDAMGTAGVRRRRAASIAATSAAEQIGQVAAEAGLTPIELAIGFALEHPAITAAIIGPRTFEQLESYLAAAVVELPTDVLDRLDEIVPPGTDVDPNASGYSPLALRTENRRRHGAGRCG